MPKAQQDKSTLQYQWYKNDTRQLRYTGNIIHHVYTSRGDTWKCVVTVDDGDDEYELGSDQVYIFNSVPSAPLIYVSPTNPSDTDDLLCSICVGSIDPDGDSIVYQYQWFKNGVLQDGLTTSTVKASNIANGQVWKCVVTASDDIGSGAAGVDQVTIINNSPVVGVDVTPDYPNTNEDLIALVTTPSTDLDGDTLIYAYRWYKNGILQPELTTNTIGASNTAKGDIWKCVVAASDGTNNVESFDEVTILNSSPTAPGVNVTPDSPLTTEDLICSITSPSTDPDGDSITYVYSWYKDGVLQIDLSANTLDDIYTADGQAWNCTVVATDDTDSSAAAFDEVTIVQSAQPNHPPTAPGVDVTPNSPVTTNNLVCSITAPSMDPDDDSITYSYRWYKNGVLQSGLTGNTVNANYTTKGEVWKCIVRASDGMDSSSGGYDEVTICNILPTTPGVQVTPSSPTTSDNLVCSITAASTDTDGDTITYCYQWYKNGALQSGLTSNGVNATYTTEGEVWKCVVTASDGTGSSGSDYDQVTIAQQTDQATYYVDGSHGSDSNNGRTIDSPFKTIGKSASVVQAGDVVHIRGGVYSPSSYVNFSRSGNSSNRITFEAYPGETVIIDGSNVTNDYIVRVTASWNTLRNLEVRNSARQGIWVTDCSHDVFENIETHDNYLSGLQIYNGYYHELRNVVSYSNYDNGTWGGGANGDNSDGIGISSGGNNLLVGCVLYDNSDDGLDLWKSTSNIVEKCVAHDNGYDNGNGNGFKLGPGVNSVASNIIRNCISYNNGSAGFTTNSGANNEVYNNTAYDNYGNGFESWSYTNIFRNNIAYGNDVELDSAVVQSHNSWNLGVSNPRFVSTDPSSPNFLALMSDSSAIDRGTNVGIPYSGAAPDLGALEYGTKIGDLVPSF